MICILRTTDPVALSFAKAVLTDARVEHFEMDQHMSILEPGIMIPKRLMILAADEADARDALKGAGLGHELEPAQSGRA